MNKSNGKCEDVSPSKEGVSLLGISRYGRTRKPKISEDFCDIDDAIERVNVPHDSPKGVNKPEFKSPIKSSDIKIKNVLNKSVETGSVSNTKVYDVKIKSISHPNTAKTNSQGTRKFFKTVRLQPHITGDYVSPKKSINDEAHLIHTDINNIFDPSPIDVSQVLKIITSKNIPEEHVDTQTKNSPKQVKTYVNKRKKINQQAIVIESFGLPDEPIIPLVDSDVPFESIKEIDVVSVEPEKVNLIDTNFMDNFWQIQTTSKYNVAEQSIEDKHDINTELCVKNKENVCTLRITRSKSQCDELNQSHQSDEELEKTEDDKPLMSLKKKRKHSESPAKSIAKLEKQIISPTLLNVRSKAEKIIESKQTKDVQNNSKTKNCFLTLNEVQLTQKQENVYEAFPHVYHNKLENVESCNVTNDKFINISKLKDKLSTKIENGRHVYDAELIKMKKSPVKQETDDIVAEIDVTIEYSKDQLREIIGQIDQTYEVTPKSSITPKSEDLKTSPAEEVLMDTKNSKSFTIDKSMEDDDKRVICTTLPPKVLTSLNETNDIKTRKSSPELITNDKSMVDVDEVVSIKSPTKLLTPVNKTTEPKTRKSVLEAITRSNLKSMVITDKSVNGKDESTKSSPKCLTPINKTRDSKTRQVCLESSANDKSLETVDDGIISNSSSPKLLMPVNKIKETRTRRSNSNSKNNESVIIDKSVEDEGAKSMRSSPKCLTPVNKTKETRSRRSGIESITKDEVVKEVGSVIRIKPTTSTVQVLKESEMKQKSISNSTIKEKLIKDTEVTTTTLPKSATPPKEILKKSSKERQETKLKSTSVSDTNGKRIDLGDLMWAKIGNFPYWPCLITLEPDSKQFSKTQKRYKLYHIRFFGDNGRRSWVQEKNLLPFASVDELEKLQAKNANERFVPTPNSRHQKNWLIGIEEAKSIQNQTVTERLQYFTRLFEKKKQLKKRQRSEGDKDIPKTELGKRKRKMIEVNTDEIKQESDLSDTELSKPTQKEKSKRIVNKENKDVLSDSSITERRVKRKVLEQKSPKKYSKEIDSTNIILDSSESENRVTRSSISKNTEEEEVVTIQESQPFTMEDQIALYKQNNVFKGVPKERVCQICLKPGDVVKCKGRCCSYYHVDCAKIGFTGDNDESISAVIEDTNTDTSDDNQTTTNEKKVEITNISNKEVEMSSHTHEVEIVLIKDRKHLTSTNLMLNNNPDFKNLPLLDQIDQKMKEVMEPVVEKPLYADSTTDCSSTDESLSPAKNLRSRNGLVHHNGDITKKDLPKDDDDAIIGAAIEDKKLKDPDFKCKNCLDDFDPLCFVCDKKNSKSNSDLRQRCSLSMCGRFYHPECLKVWPQTQWSVSATTKFNLDTFVCPAHVCHTCVSDDPRMAISRCSSDKVVKCLRCPATYHSSTSCVPAGTDILTSTQIVCPRHGGKGSSKRRGPGTINTTWCFICSEGGTLICCETCPTSVHAECLDINYTDDDKFICEDCETGRFPLYDEVVWVKLGNFRWWPALILFPNEVPDNVKSLSHDEGEFVVKFFGTYDHYWISKGRVFVFVDGDTGGGGVRSSKKKIDNIFKKSIHEATVVHQVKKEFKESVIKQSEEKSKNKPPPYIKIKGNRPVGNVRQFDGNISNTTPCECDPKQDNPCGADSDCLNRLLMTECDPDVCPAGEKCQNQCFEKRDYPHLIPYKTEGRGWGLKSLEPITKGQFVIEYVGEMIDEQEYQKRLKKMNDQKEENYYFLTIDKDRMIDAGPKGNVARFMNHCCQPNCETQKWTVNGDTRVGLFAVADIPPDTELTFNYNLECVGKEKKICRCGAPNCSGFIGVKAKQLQEEKKSKHRMKHKKRKRSATPQIQETKEPCFLCGKTGDVIGCNNKICTKFYHSKCVSVDKWSEKWICPWHNCNICSKRTIRCCTKCVNSYCPAHSDGNIRHDSLLGFICSEHDPSKAESPGGPIMPTNRKPSYQTKETDVTSTSSFECSVELELLTVHHAHCTTEPTNIITSTPIKSKKSRLDKSSIENLQKRIKLDLENSTASSIRPKTKKKSV